MDRLLEYASHHPWLVVGAIAVALVVIVFEVRARQQDFAAISPQEAIRLMNQGALVLDLRPAEAFAEGHLNGARRMDSAEILKAGETLKKHKEKNVLVYCERGTLGASAARILAGQGFTKAVNLRGGVTAWRTEGLPLARDAEIDVDLSHEARTEMQRRSGRTSVPQIFVGDVHVGGSDDLHALEARGGLDPLLGRASTHPIPVS